MSQFPLKLKLVFVPFIVVAVVMITGYTFLNWLIFVKLEAFVIDTFYAQFVAPVVLAGIAIFLWVRPQLKLLDVKKPLGKTDWLGLLVFVAWFTIGVPIVIAQEYMVQITGKFTALNHISEINTKPVTKYYGVKHFYIDKKLVKPRTAFSVSGKHNTNFDMEIYTPCPMFDNDSLTIGNWQIDSGIVPGDKKVNPLVIVNGKTVPLSVLSLIDSTNVKSTAILKGTAATAIYGDAAKDGVIVIETIKVVPIDQQNKISDNRGRKAAAWFAVKYSETIKNSLSDREKDTAYKEFARQSQNEFNGTSFSNFTYLELISQGEQFENYKAAITDTIFGVSVQPGFILSPHYEAFEARTGSKLSWMFGSFGIGASVFLLLISSRKLLRKTPIKRKAKSRRYWLAHTKKWLIPAEGFFTTHIIISANIIAFIIMVCSGLGFMSFGADELLKWGGNYRPAVFNGQYWRLLTSTFLHGGIMHLLFNMYGLLFVGIFLEPILGRVKFVILYIVTGVLASLASIWWHPATVGVGASGAIFGMYGVFLAILTTNYFEPAFKKSFLITTSVFVGYNLLYGLIGNIDNAAHIGGLISGVIAGYIIYFTVLKGIVKKEEL